MMGDPSGCRGYDTYSLWQQQQQQSERAAPAPVSAAATVASPTTAPVPDGGQAHGRRSKSSHVSLLTRLKHLLQCTVPASTTDLALHAQRLTQAQSTQQQQQQQELAGCHPNTQPEAAGQPTPLVPHMLGLQQQVAAVGEQAASLGTPHAEVTYLTTSSSPDPPTVLTGPNPAGPVGAQRQLFVQAAAAAGIPVVVPASWPTAGAATVPPATFTAAAGPSPITAGRPFSPPGSSAISQPSSASVPAPICRRSLVDLGAALAAARAAGSPSVLGAAQPLRRSSVIISPKSKRSVFRHRAHLRTSGPGSSTTTLAPLQSATSNQAVSLQQHQLHMDGVAPTSCLAQQHLHASSLQPDCGSGAPGTTGVSSPAAGAVGGRSSPGIAAGTSSSSSSKGGGDHNQMQFPAQQGDTDGLADSAAGGVSQQLQTDEYVGHPQQQEVVPATPSGQTSSTADTAAFLGKPRRLLQPAGASSTVGEAAGSICMWELGVVGHQEEGSLAMLPNSAGSGSGWVPCAGGGAGVVGESAPGVSSAQAAPGLTTPVVRDQGVAPGVTAGGATTPELSRWGSGAVSSDGWPNSRGGSRSITPCAAAAPTHGKDAAHAQQGLAQLLGPQLAARGIKTVGSSDAEEYASCSSLLESVPAAPAAMAAAVELAADMVEGGCDARDGIGLVTLPSGSDLVSSRRAGSDGAASWLAPWAPEGVPAADVATASAAAATWEAMGGALAAYGRGNRNEGSDPDGSQAAQQQQQQQAWQQTSGAYSPAAGDVVSAPTAGMSTPVAPSSSRQPGGAHGAATATSSSSQATAGDSPGKETGDDSAGKDTARHKDQHLVRLLRQLSINSIITADEQQVLCSPIAAASCSPETPGGGPSSPAAPNSSSFKRLGTSDADNHTATGLPEDVAAADAQLRLYYAGSTSSSEGYGQEDGEEGCDSGDTSLLEQWLLESHAGGPAAGTSSRLSSRAASFSSSRSAAVQRGKGHGPSRLARNSLAGASRNSSFDAAAAAAVAQRRMEAAAAASQAAATSSASDALMSDLLAQQLAAPGLAWPMPLTTAPAAAPAAPAAQQVASLAFTDCAWPSTHGPTPGGRGAVSSNARAAAQLSAVRAEGHVDSVPSMAFTDCAWPHAGGTHSRDDPLAAPPPAAPGAPAIQQGGRQEQAPPQQGAAALRRSAAAGPGGMDVLSSLVGATLAQQLQWPDTAAQAPAAPMSVTTAKGAGSEDPQYTEQGASGSTAVLSLQGGFMGISAAGSDASVELGVGTQPPAPPAAAGLAGADAAGFGLHRDSWMRSSFNPLYDSAARAVTPPPIPAAAQGVGGAAAGSDGPGVSTYAPAPAAAATPSMLRPPVPRPPKVVQGWLQGDTQNQNQNHSQNQSQQQGLRQAEHEQEQPQPRQTPPPPPLQQQQGVQTLGVSTAAARAGAAVPPPDVVQHLLPGAAAAPVRAAAAVLKPAPKAGPSSSSSSAGPTQQQGVPSLLQRLIEDLSCLNTLIAQQGLQEAESAQLKQVLMSDALQQLQGHLQAPKTATSATSKGTTAACAAPTGAGAGVPCSPKDRAAAAAASKMIRNSIDLLTALTSGSNLVNPSSSSPQQRLAAAFSSSLYGVSTLPPSAAAAAAVPSALATPAAFPGEDSAWQGAETSVGRGTGGPSMSSAPASHPSGDAAAAAGAGGVAADSRGMLAGTAGNALAPLTVRLHPTPQQSSSDGSNSTNAFSAPLVVVQQGGQQVKLSHFRPSLEDTVQQQMDSVVQAQLKGVAAASSSAMGPTPPDVLHGLKWAQKLAKQAALARPGTAAVQPPPAAALQPGGAGADSSSGRGVTPPAAAATVAQALAAAAAPVAPDLSAIAAAPAQENAVGGDGGMAPCGTSPVVTPRAIPCSSPTPGITSAPPAPPAVMLESEPRLSVRAPSMQLLGADADLASADVLLGSPMMRSQNSFLGGRPLSTPASLAPSSTGLLGVAAGTGVVAATPTAAVSHTGGFGGSSFGSPALGGQQQGYVTPSVTLPSLGGSPGGLVCPGGPRPPTRAISRRPPQLVSATSPTPPPAAATHPGMVAPEAGGPTSPFRCSKNLLPVFEAEVAAGAGWHQPQLGVQAGLPLVSEGSIGPHMAQQPPLAMVTSPGVSRPRSSRPMAASSPQQLAGAATAAQGSSQMAAGSMSAARCSQAAAAAAGVLKDQLVARLSGRDIGAMSLEELDQVYRSLSSSLRDAGDAGSPKPAAVL